MDPVQVRVALHGTARPHRYEDPVNLVSEHFPPEAMPHFAA